MVKVKVRDVQLFESDTIISVRKWGQRDILLICGFSIGTHPVEPVDPVKGWFR